VQLLTAAVAAEDGKVELELVIKALDLTASRVTCSPIPSPQTLAIAEGLGAPHADTILCSEAGQSSERTPFSGTPFENTV
jgi:hypothetical protein